MGEKEKERRRKGGMKEENEVRFFSLLLLHTHH